MDFTLSSLTHYSEFAGIPDRYYEFIFEEWRSHGVDKLILISSQLERAVQDRAFAADFIQKAGKHGIRFADAHVPWSREWALNTPAEYRETMFKNIQEALAVCAEAGCRTLTIHVGDVICWDVQCGVTLQQGRDLLDDALEHLIPAAEKNKVVFCIENIIAPTDQPDELIRCFQRFSSDYFGCCFDSGHANVMAYFPGKDPERLSPWIRDSLWQGAPQYYKGDALRELLPHIVTCHLHDNNGYGDQHLPPCRGTVNWQEVLDLLKQAPRLKTLQNECSLFSGGATSISNMLQAFEQAGFQR